MKLINADALPKHMVDEDIFVTFDYEIVAAPAIDAVRVVHARWAKLPAECKVMCSNCGTKMFRKSDFFSYRDMFCEGAFLAKYCPNCGARMDLEDDGKWLRG